MLFEIKQCRPHPIPEKSIAENSIWRSDYTRIECPNNYQILASSGKGKSTLVAYLYGLRNDYSGQVLLDGTEVRKISLSAWSELRKNKLSVVFQDMRLFPRLTVMENLEVKNRLTNHKTTAQIASMLEEYGLGDKHHQTCGTLSLGQQQRVAIIRSLLQPFAMLLMDEPFSHLDNDNIRIGCAMIEREAAANGGGYMYTTLGEKYFFNAHHTITI
jgi:ABC-type lipoprotein export system ATPase subunit